MGCQLVSVGKGTVVSRIQEYTLVSIDVGNGSRGYTHRGGIYHRHCVAMTAENLGTHEKKAIGGKKLSIRTNKICLPLISSSDSVDMVMDTCPDVVVPLP